MQSYADIDQMYFDILKIGIDHPDLRNPEKTCRYHELIKDERIRYENYAYICWNLCETIFDRQSRQLRDIKVSDTWMPVILEENRLHGVWFVHNLRLFKKPFQDFIRYMVNALDISDLDPANTAEMEEMLAVYNSNFPDSERIPRDHLIKLINDHTYRVLLARHRSFQEIIGFALIADFKEPIFSHLDYMAIDPKYQRSGYGTILFQTIAENLPNNSIGLLLEVEDPDLATSAADKKKMEDRIRFYRQLGCRSLTVKYLFPNHPPLPMILMFKPSQNVRLLPQNDLAAMITEVYDSLHGNVPDRAAMFETFAHTVTDQSLNERPE